MAPRPVSSVFGILSWMKEQLPVKYVTVEKMSARFGMDREQMRRNLQWLQRYECVRRGGDDSAEWGITELGLVRLGEGRFSKGGAFLSAYEYSGGSERSNQVPGRIATEAIATTATASDTLDTWTESTVPIWARPALETGPGTR